MYYYVKHTKDICDVSSEKVPEPAYVNIEKIAKTRPKVNFTNSFLLAQMTSYQLKMVSASLVKNIQRLSRFRACCLAKSFDPPCFFLMYGQNYIIYRETYIVARKTDLKAIPGCLLLLLEI